MGCDSRFRISVCGVLFAGFVHCALVVIVVV